MVQFTNTTSLDAAASVFGQIVGDGGLVYRVGETLGIRSGQTAMSKIVFSASSATSLQAQSPVYTTVLYSREANPYGSSGSQLLSAVQTIVVQNAGGQALHDVRGSEVMLEVADQDADVLNALQPILVACVLDLSDSRDMNLRETEIERTSMFLSVPVCVFIAQLDALEYYQNCGVRSKNETRNLHSVSKTELVPLRPGVVSPSCNLTATQDKYPSLGGNGA